MDIWLVKPNLTCIDLYLICVYIICMYVFISKYIYLYNIYLFCYTITTPRYLFFWTGLFFQTNSFTNSCTPSLQVLKADIKPEFPPTIDYLAWEYYRCIKGGMIQIVLFSFIRSCVSLWRKLLWHYVNETWFRLSFNVYLYFHLRIAHRAL